MVIANTIPCNVPLAIRMAEDFAERFERGLARAIQQLRPFEAPQRWSHGDFLGSMGHGLTMDEPTSLGKSMGNPWEIRGKSWVDHGVAIVKHGLAMVN